MSINIGKINISPINRRHIESEEIYISSTLSADLASFVTRGTNVFDGQTLSASLRSFADGTRGFIASMTANTALSAYAEPTKRRTMTAHMCAQGTQYALGSLNAHLESKMEATLYHTALIGKNLLRAEQMNASLQASVYGAKNLYSGNIRWNASLLQAASTILFSFIDATLNLDIPAGATLVIDASGYVVLLDGENVIWAHSGDWPYFARETYDVEFSTLDGAPIGDESLLYRVLYTERYL